MSYQTAPGYPHYVWLTVLLGDKPKYKVRHVISLLDEWFPLAVPGANDNAPARNVSATGE